MGVKRVSEWCFAVLFCLFLAVILVTSIRSPQEQYSVYENRLLSEAPEGSLATAADGSYFSSWETYLCEHGAFRTEVMEGITWLDLNVLHRPVINDVVVTNQDVLLSYEEYEVVDSDGITCAAQQMGENLSTLQNVVESYGGTFLYVAVPSHYAYFEERYPWYLNNRSAYTQAEKEAFFSALDAYGVNWLDIGEVWDAEGSPDSYMSTVDHHYTWEGCASTYEAILQRLYELTGESLPVLTDGDVSLTTLSNPYLGSYSRKLCDQWESSEKLTYATLVSAVDFLRFDWGNEAASPMTTVTLPETEEEQVAYTMYMGGDISETIIQTQRPELPSVLLYGDSFTNALETILYGDFDEMRSLDLRHYEEMSLTEYVQAYQPEYVICLRDYEQLLSFEGNGRIA